MDAFTIGPDCGFCKLYTPEGVLVTLPVTAAPADYAAMLANVRAALAAGFLVNAPGLEGGEHRDDVGFVVRRSKQNEDGTETPVIDLYPAEDAIKFALLSVYLNRPEDVAAFEYAAKVKLDDLPPYIGTNKIERGANRQTDRLVVRVPKPFGVVWKDNPKYDPDEQDTKKKKPKRLFVRWADQKPAGAGQAADPPAGERKAIAAAGSLAELATHWNALPADLKVQLVADKDRRKAELLEEVNRLRADLDHELHEARTNLPAALRTHARALGLDPARPLPTLDQLNEAQVRWLLARLAPAAELFGGGATPAANLPD